MDSPIPGFSTKRKWPDWPPDQGRSSSPLVFFVRSLKRVGLFAGELLKTLFHILRDPGLLVTHVSFDIESRIPLLDASGPQVRKESNPTI